MANISLGGQQLQKQRGTLIQDVKDFKLEARSINPSQQKTEQTRYLYICSMNISRMPTVSEHTQVKVLNAPSVFSVDRQHDHGRAVRLNKIKEANRDLLFIQRFSSFTVYQINSLYQYRLNKHNNL